jgi:hypothetical protein
LKHIPSGIGFRETGPAAWPRDQFTQRRVRDGSVKLLGPAVPPPRESESREQAN